MRAQDGRIEFVLAAFLISSLAFARVQGRIEDTGGQVYNVAAYGANPNGATDDTAALQSLLNKFSSRGRGCKSGRIFFPTGTYLITSTLVYAGNVSCSLEMSGAQTAARGGSGSQLLWKVPGYAPIYFGHVLKTTGFLSYGDYGSGGAANPAANALTNVIMDRTEGVGAPLNPCKTGSIYTRTDGDTGSTLYVCEAGKWAAK